LINLGFIDRFDIYGMILMTFGVYIRCSLFFRIAYELSLPKDLSKWTKRIIFSLFAVVRLLSTFYLANEHFRIEKSIIIYAYMVILFPIPYVLLLISWMKKIKHRRI